MYVEMRPAGRIFFTCIPNGLLVGPRTSAWEKVRSFSYMDAVSAADCAELTDIVCGQEEAEECRTPCSRSIAVAGFPVGVRQRDGRWLAGWRS